MKGERLFADYIPWRDYLAPDIVLLAQGGVFAMLEIDGLPSETADDAVRDHRHTVLEFALRDVAIPGLIFHVLQCRGVADPEVYPGGTFRTAFAETLDIGYRERLFGTRSMWLNRTYLAIQVDPRQTGGAWLRRWTGRVYGEQPGERVGQLHRIVGILTEQLREYHPRRLGLVERDGRLFSEIAEAMMFALTGYWRAVPMTTSGPAAIASESVIVGYEVIEIRMPHRSTYAACLNMHDFPYLTGPGMFDRFLATGYRHTVVNAFRCLASTDGVALAVRKQNRGRSSGDRAISQIAHLTQAADMIASKQMLVGDHAFVLTVFADELTALPMVVEKAWSDLSTGGIKTERENLALEAVYVSMIPGNFDLRGREAAVSSRNYAAFAGLANFPAGDARGPWGDPLALLRTSGGTPFRFHLHSGGVGNCFISGETGSGKTTFLGFLLCQAERTGATCVLWDKDQGLRALVHALDGTYIPLLNQPGIGTGIAPLQRLTDSPEDMAFLAGLIRACAATPQPYHFTPEEDRRLGIALRHVLGLPPELRCLREVRAFLGTSRDGAGARLEKWCRGGEFGWVIDGERDRIDLSGPLIAFDQSGLIEDPIAAGATLATLFHYTGKLVDGRRLLFVLDEMWNALRIEQFHGEIHNGLKTWRKYNSPIILGTQSVADALASPIAHTIREQCPTQIYFSNPGAVWEEYGPHGMHRSATEFDIVRKLPKGTGHFLLVQGNRSVVLQAPLAGMDEVQVISGTRASRDAIEAALSATRNQGGPAFVAAYHRFLERQSS